MAKYSFLVRETLSRDRIYEIDADNEYEARNLLDGFKQRPVERSAAQENIRVDDYEIKDCYRSDPQIGDQIKYKGELGSLSSLRGNWIINTLSHTLPIRTVELEWDEDGNYWTVTGDDT